MRLPFPLELGPGPTRPTEVRGLALWLDAADAGTLLGDDLAPTAVGSGVRQWSDKGPGGAHAAQAATSPRPMRVVAGGRAGVQFDGIDDALLVAAPALLSGKAGATVFLAIRAASVGGSFVRPLLVSTGTNATSTRLTINRVPGDSPQLSARRLDTDVAVTLTAASAATANALEIECHSIDLGAGVGTVRRNGAEVGAASGLLTPGAFDAAGSLTVCVGSNNGGNVLAGTLHEVIVYGRCLGAAERASLERYLRAKWGTA